MNTGKTHSCERGERVQGVDCPECEEAAFDPTKAPSVHFICPVCEKLQKPGALCTRHYAADEMARVLLMVQSELVTLKARLSKTYRDNVEAVLTEVDRALKLAKS